MPLPNSSQTSLVSAGVCREPGFHLHASKLAAGSMHTWRFLGILGNDHVDQPFTQKPVDGNELEAVQSRSFVGDIHAYWPSWSWIQQEVCDAQSSTNTLTHVSIEIKYVGLMKASRDASWQTMMCMCRVCWCTQAGIASCPVDTQPQRFTWPLNPSNWICLWKCRLSAKSSTNRCATWQQSRLIGMATIMLNWPSISVLACGP